MYEYIHRSLNAHWVIVFLPPDQFREIDAQAHQSFQYSLVRKIYFRYSSYPVELVCSTG